MSGGDLATFAGQAVVVGLGWWVVHRLSAARDMDKARRDLVARSADSLSEALNDLLTESRQYHLGERDLSRELHIKMTLQDLGMRMAGLSTICGDESLLARCRADIGGVRRAITGHHFEDEHTGPLGESATELQAMAEATLRAKRGLLDVRHAQFSVRSTR